MSIRSKMPCWEIIQCNKEQTCLFAENETKACWEMVEDDDACSFHVCVDCLVYLAKHEDSFLTKEEFHSILAQRKNTINNRIQYKWIPSHTFSDSAIQAKGTVKKHRPIQHDAMFR